LSHSASPEGSLLKTGFFFFFFKLQMTGREEAAEQFGAAALIQGKMAAVSLTWLSHHWHKHQHGRTGKWLPHILQKQFRPHGSQNGSWGPLGAIQTLELSA
jgi:hypothetical protein